MCMEGGGRDCDFVHHVCEFGGGGVKMVRRRVYENFAFTKSKTCELICHYALINKGTLCVHVNS